MKKPSEIFEGPNSSLRKTFDEAVRDDVCEYCNGTGEIATDEDDGEGHTMRGVGTRKCICQSKEID